MKGFTLGALAAIAKAEETDTLLQAARVRKQQWQDADTPDFVGTTRGGGGETPCASFRAVKEDCTHQDFYVWKGDPHGDYFEPTYPATEYGSDDLWETRPVNETLGWETLCVAYVKTKDTSCDEWCAEQGMVCNKARDDAHWQTKNLDNWLKKSGYSQSKCTISTQSSELTEEVFTGKQINLEGNGCAAKRKTQICGCAEFRPDGRRRTITSDCTWSDVTLASPTFGEDCTAETFHVYKGNHEDFAPPSYPTNTNGADTNWTTTPVILQHENYFGSCVAYVTGLGDGRGHKKSCGEWCIEQGMTCVKGMDDAHHQRVKLNEWQEAGGYEETSCTLWPKGASRQPDSNDGCDQRWDTQICACIY